MLGAVTEAATVSQTAKSSIPIGSINDSYRPHLDNLARVQILFGGASSGKSVFAAQRAVRDVAGGGRNYLVCRQVGRTLRGSVVQEIRKVIAGWGMADQFAMNKTDGTATHLNGYQIIFTGLDDVEKLKSITPAKGSVTDVWVEEATETNKNTVRQLMRRQRGGDPNTPKRLTLTFNPILRSNWVYEEYFKSVGWAVDQREHRADGLSIFKTTYKDNRFLTPDDVRDLENETDPYYRDVYTLGNWGVLGNIIFTKWRVENLSGMVDQFANRKNGLDFGFSSDPAALPVTHYDKAHKIIYVFKELYERGLTNDLLADEVKELIGRDYVVCDSSEPKSIAELQGYGVTAGAAKKGKDSIVHGIQWLQQQTIVIDSGCINTQNEIQGYKWREDKDGNAIRQPVDRNNHLIDALRYAYEDEFDSGPLFYDDPKPPAQTEAEWQDETEREWLVGEDD
jgi:phage terminase large subunit